MIVNEPNNKKIKEINKHINNETETFAKSEGLNGPQITGIVLGSLTVVSIVVFIVIKNKKKNKVINDKLENNVPITISSNQSTSSEDSTIVSPPHPPQASQKDGLPTPPIEEEKIENPMKIVKDISETKTSILGQRLLMLEEE